jgi:acyl carrier protein
MTPLELEIRQFIAEVLTAGEDRPEIDRDASLTRTGLLDSIAVVELIGFLESRYGIEILDVETTPEHFDTLAGLARLVRAKLASPEPPPCGSAGLGSA